MTDRTFFHQGDCAMSAAFIGLDLAKSVFQVHGVDVQGKVVVTKRLRRDAVLVFFTNLAPCVIPTAGEGFQ
jgi:transposase